MPFTAAHKVEFDKRYKKADTINAKDTALVSIVYKLIGLVEASDQAYRAVVHAKHMGIHSNKSQQQEDAILLCA